ncbi:MAG: PSD1 and planctomycete cytochrome C domain-containing protein, partial [Novipirellula sp. JB048]
MTTQRIQLVLMLLVGALGLPAAIQAGEAIRFSRDVLPILADRCFHCHGPDPEHRAADLRLDQRASAIEENAVIVPREPEASELIARIRTTDRDQLMPPPESHRKPLTPHEIAILQRWIAEGAEWGTHWAFEKPLRPTPPQVDLHPIDAFVRQRLEPRGLQPAAEADRRTLIRRVTLDLIGLPPTAEEVATFVADDSEDAYERLVDRLLRSPHYGERMAWPWLDAARYADTSGYQGDPERSMWPWRDWVVTAFNDNMPFDQFTIEQLAGDLLPNPTPEQRLATGFNRNHMHNGEGGRIAEETRVENVFDRAETTATVWLGLTLQCARCHDHKFDPTTNVDYFAFTDFFNQTSEAGRIVGGLAVPPAMDYLPRQRRREIEEAKRRIAELSAQLVAPAAEADAAQADWEMPWRDGMAVEWQILDPLEFRSSGGATITKRADSSLHVSGERPEQDVYEITLSRERDPIRGIRLEALIDPASPAQATGRDAGGNFVLSEIEVTDSKLPAGHDAGVATLLRTPVAQRRAEDHARLREHFRRVHWKPTAQIARRLDAARRELVALQAKSKPVPVMVMDTRAEPRETFVLTKGLYNQPTDRKVIAAVPSMLPPLAVNVENETPTRLDLARWIVSAENPLTARVMVNRYWQTFFGRGIVATMDDFGLQGAQPTHPDLLDWMAIEFVESGWDVKHMHRLIVTSQTYRQSAFVTPESWAQDPKNQLLSRAPRYRMPSWMIRDQALAASGLWVPAVGGAPVKPYQPDGIWAEATFGKIRYQADSGDKLYRRSLYTFWRRIVGPTILVDAAKRQTCEVTTSLTNTPLHALTTLNDVTYIEAARV